VIPFIACIALLVVLWLVLTIFYILF